MSNSELLSTSTRRSFSSGTLDLNTVFSRVQTCHGFFKSRVEMCHDLSADSWKCHVLEITESGTLKYHLDSSPINSLNTPEDPVIVDIEKSNTIIEHLQSCKLQLIEDKDNILPTIRIETTSNSEHVRVHDAATFEALFCSLLWWSAFKSEGIFSKTTFQAPNLRQQKKSPEKVLVSQLLVYGPIPHSRNIALLKHIGRPSFLPDSHTSEGWFPAMGVLKSNGILDLLLQSDGSLLYSLDITVLTRTEIRVIDSSLHGENYLFLGVLPELRDEHNISRDCKFILDGRSTKPNNGIIFKFPLMIDVEDWIVALSSFALSEKISLIGSHESNRLRISNRFKLTIIEGDFLRSDLIPHSPTLYVECLLWGRIWARTPIVANTFTPFWREEFFFNESTRINNLRIEIKQVTKNKGNKSIGFIELSQESISDGSLSKETRLPVIDAEDGKTKIGTLCIKMISSLNFVLPAVNFTSFESILSESCLKSLANHVNDSSFGYDLKFEDFAMVLLDIFQAIQKESAWFSALIDRELTDVDGSITRNTINKKTSSHIYSTLFRGNTPLTKSIEKYFYRVGKEYLDKSIGNILREIVYRGISCEVDPSRVNEPDPAKKMVILENNRKRLVTMVGEVWSIIYNTSNDLPMSIKMQMKTFRQKVEIICVEDDTNTVLNCVSGLLFLRFFCPVILNPKLFDFVVSHLENNSRRTLTLISKVLLNLSNVTYFGKKEPYMLELNGFIDAHKEEVLDYVDKVTQKKLDFLPKTLKLSSAVARPKLVMNEGVLTELPTNPYLIDRYLRETELFTVLARVATNRDGDPKILQSVSIEQITKNVAHLEVSPQKVAVDIGELEFEKVSNNNTEVFGNDLMKYLEKEKSTTPEHDEFIRSRPEDESYRMKELEQESILLLHRSEHLKQVFSDYEVPMEEVDQKINYAKFVAQNAYYTKENKIFVDKNINLDGNSGVNRLFDPSTGRSALLERLIPIEGIELVERSSLTSSYDNAPVKLRGFSRLTSKKVRRNSSRVSEESKTPEVPGIIKRWFKRTK